MNTNSLDASRLEALLESAQLLNSSLDLDSLLKHLLRTVMGRALVGRGFVAVETGGAMRYAQMRGLKNVVIIAAALQRRTVARRQFVTFDIRQKFGKKSFLNARGEL